MFGAGVRGLYIWTKLILCHVKCCVYAKLAWTRKETILNITYGLTNKAGGIFLKGKTKFVPNALIYIYIYILTIGKQPHCGA